MKRVWSFLLALVMALSLAACGNDNAAQGSTPATPSPTPEATEPTVAPDASQPAESPEASGEEEGGGILIAYFSRVGNTDFDENTDTNTTASVVATEDGLQGNTEVIARMIQQALGGDLFLIETVDKYPVSYDETIDVGQSEGSAEARPALAATVENLDEYDTIFLGFPNWWYDMPMAVYSFLDAYDLSGKTIVPFVTSGGSGFSGALDTIAELEPDATVTDGFSVGGGSATGAQEDVNTWLAELGLLTN